MSAATTALRQSVLTTYRALVRAINGLPKDQRKSAMQECQTAFRDNLTTNDPHEVKLLLMQAESKLSYLRMVTPHKPKAGHFVIRNGKILSEDSIRKDWPEYERKGVRKEDLERHYKLLRRQHFMKG